MNSSVSTETQPSTKTYYRSVWISDVHLGCRDARAEELCEFLDSMTCETLYLVGDILDCWALRRGWYWPGAYNEVVHKLLKRARKGTRVIYIPGNHDDIVRQYAGYRLGEIEVTTHCYHNTLDGRHFLVIHGDQFDTVVRYHPWLSHLGSWAYGHLVGLNRLVNLIGKKMGKPYWSFCGTVKRRVKQAVKFVNRFEKLLVDGAKREDVDGVICGHIHHPAMHEMDGVLYCNCGDWVESCTALVEDETGKLEIVWWHRERERRERIRTLTDQVATAGAPAPSHAPGGRRWRQTA